MPSNSESGQTSADGENGVGVPNVICYSDHGSSGQIMERIDSGGYECPECHRMAGLTVQWEDPD